MTRLGGGRVLVGDRLQPGDLDVADGRITGFVAPTRGSGRIVAPGFVDLQVNGFAGVDFASCGPEQLRAAASAMRATGVTAFLPTLVTGPVDSLRRALGVVGELSAEPTGGAVAVGAHLEGPFLSPDRLGAHDPSHRRDPDLATLEDLLSAGPVARVTLAPELPGAAELIVHLIGRGIEVSAGHTAATAEQAHHAFDLGVRSTTHHGNAMDRFHHREPGIFAAALLRPDVAPTIIVDGHHLHADTVRLIVAAAGERVVLVTDAVGAPAGTDLADGRLGGTRFVVEDGAVRNRAGDLAGSTLTLDRAVRNCVDIGIDPATALAAASTRPRALLGLAHGREIRVGGPADLVVLDADLGVVDSSIGPG